MRMSSLFESDPKDVTLDDIDLTDALYILSMMADDEKLNNREMMIISEMLEQLLEGDELHEADIVDHADTEEKRMATFAASPASERIRNRLYQRRYRNRSDVKMLARKRAAVEKRCKDPNRSAQLVAPGSTTFACKIKDRMRSKLMQRVSQRYG